MPCDAPVMIATLVLAAVVSLMLSTMARQPPAPPRPAFSLLVGRTSHCADLCYRSRSRPLERALGTRLFDRDRRQVTLTPAGEALLPRIRALLEQADELRRAAAGLSAHECRRSYGRAASGDTTWA